MFSSSYRLNRSKGSFDMDFFLLVPADGLGTGDIVSQKTKIFTDASLHSLTVVNAIDTEYQTVLRRLSIICAVFCF